MLNISFITGTRADYGKIKPIIDYLLHKKKFKIYLFVTGMHLYKKYGKTINLLIKDYGTKCTIIKNCEKVSDSTTSRMLNVIKYYERHLLKDKIDYVFVHGDRPDALGAALAASFNNIPICHMEAGELSGSIDEVLRHSISKLAQKFFVSDNNAKTVLIQLGENKKDIHVLGEPSLANLEQKSSPSFKIPFSKYGILSYHPVTTDEPQHISAEIKGIMSELLKSKMDYVVILPNNDKYHEIILQEYKAYRNNRHFKFYPSLPFETFTNTMKRACFLIGNSSCAIKEAPYYNLPAIDIGCRQQGRYTHLNFPFLYHLNSYQGISKTIAKISPHVCHFDHKKYRAKLFKRLDQIITNDFFHPPIQKKFYKRKHNV